MLCSGNSIYFYAKKANFPTVAVSTVVKRWKDGVQRSEGLFYAQLKVFSWLETFNGLYCWMFLE